MKQLTYLSMILIFLTLSACETTGTAMEQPFVQNPVSMFEHEGPGLKKRPKMRKPPIDVAVHAEAAILIYAGDGEPLFHKNSEKALPVASMSKVMSELLVLEAIANGAVDWEDIVPISDYAYAISNHPGFSSVLLKQGQDYTVRELFNAMVIRSANGATIALAEKVSGSEKEFVSQMNDKAKQLELAETDFVNSTGLSNMDLGDYYTVGSAGSMNIMSARDMANLVKYVIDHYPELLETTSMLEFDFQGETYSNSNWMLPDADIDYMLDIGLDATFAGVDGFKTGYIDEAGYCFTGTVTIEGERYISVVMGTPRLEDRFLETKMLYEAVYQEVNKQNKY